MHAPNSPRSSSLLLGLQLAGVAWCGGATVLGAQRPAEPVIVRVWAPGVALAGHTLAVTRVAGDTLVLRRLAPDGTPSRRSEDQRWAAATDVVRLDIRDGQRSRATGAGRGMVTGMGVGTLLGVLVGGAMGSDMGSDGASVGAVMGAAAGVLVGTIGGALIGAASPGERWTTVYHPPAIVAWPFRAGEIVEHGAADTAGSSLLAAPARIVPNASAAGSTAVGPVGAGGAPFLPAGSLARVTVPELQWRRVTVLVESATRDSLFVHGEAPGSIVPVAVESLTRLELPHHSGTRFDRAGRFAIWGALIGPAVTIGWHAVRGVDGPARSSEPGANAVGGAILGIAAGAMLGAMIGPATTWTDVPVRGGAPLPAP